MKTYILFFASYDTHCFPTSFTFFGAIPNQLKTTVQIGFAVLSRITKTISI